MKRSFSFVSHSFITWSLCLVCFQNLSSQTIICDGVDLAGFYELYGGQDKFSQHTKDALNTFIQTENAIERGNYTSAKALLNRLFNSYPKGGNTWRNVWTRPNNANLGIPNTYYGLRMLEDIVDYNLNKTIPVNSQPIKMKVLLVGESKGVLPSTERELKEGTGTFVTNTLNEQLRSADYCMIKQSLQLFTKYVTAITKGSLTLEVEFIELPEVSMDVSVSSSQPYRATGGIGAVWDALDEEVKNTTDWWWVLYPSHVPSNPTFNDKAFITGGMGADRRGGPVFIIDDKWLTRKPPHLGKGNYNDIERRVYLPQWLQHEFFHHLFRIFPEYSLESTGHDWFDRSTWPEDFVGQYEADYYTESLHKRLMSSNELLTQRLITRQNDRIKEYYAALTLEDLKGTYAVDVIQNDWQEGQILEIDNALYWKNNAGVQWSLTPQLEKGVLETNEDCPYLGQDFYIEFYELAHSQNIPSIKGFTFQGQLYRKK